MTSTKRFLSLWLLFILLTSPIGVKAQVWLEEPTIRVCELGRCDDDESIDLTDEELEYADKLLEVIPANSSRRDIAARMGRDAVHISPSTPIKLGSANMTAYRATWMVDSQSQAFVGAHFDVYFANDKVFLVKWWFNGMNKHVDFSYVR